MKGVCGVCVCFRELRKCAPGERRGGDVEGSEKDRDVESVSERGRCLLLLSLDVFFFFTETGTHLQERDFHQQRVLLKDVASKHLRGPTLMTTAGQKGKGLHSPNFPPFCGTPPLL